MKANRWRTLGAVVAALALATMALPGAAVASHSSSHAIYMNLVPEQDENPLRGVHVITAVARNSSGNTVSGAEVNIEIVDGPNDDLDSGVDLECETGSDGTCDVSYTDASAALGDDDVICGWLDSDDDDDYDDNGSDADGGDCEDEAPDETENSARAGTDVFGNDVTDVIVNTWRAGSDAFYLNATPESATKDPGSQHTIDLAARTKDGDPAQGVSVDVEIISGPTSNLDGDAADADLECTTNDSGSCSVSYTGSSSGVDSICAWLDIEDDDDFSKSGAISDGGACDDETFDEPENSDRPGPDTFGNDATDVVRRSWGKEAGLPRACEAEGAIVGTNGNDTLVGTSGDDVICGLGGSDGILGHGGDDLIIGGAGGDNIRGGGGLDTIKTGDGKDTAVGQGGDDNLRGQAGDDYLLGSRNDDVLFGGGGSDVLDGGRHFDACQGGKDEDRTLKCETSSLNI